MVLNSAASSATSSRPWSRAARVQISLSEAPHCRAHHAQRSQQTRGQGDGDQESARRAAATAMTTSCWNRCALRSACSLLRTIASWFMSRIRSAACFVSAKAGGQGFEVQTIPSLQCGGGQKFIERLLVPCPALAQCCGRLAFARFGDVVLLHAQLTFRKALRCWEMSPRTSRRVRQLPTGGKLPDRSREGT